ncbi:acetyl-CoA acetyltransferase [Tistrella sp. BH-R2-4]|uniref:Acetyl-CoA acetyltransferase n=1 Tax=Tistrella arctica TaxID=3133430 RepID=A0ABU9YQQ5_9PROT
MSATDTRVCIAGWAHTPFGKLDALDLEALIVQAARDAMAHAGIDGAQVDGIFVGLFNNGFSAQDFAAGLALQADPGLRFKPATRVENACATGSAAIHAAQDFIRAGRGRVVLVIGAEQMSRTAGDKVGDLLLGASYRREEGNIPGGFAGVFGQIAQAYFAKNGDQMDALAMIAAKNHRNGCANPYAQMRRDFGFEFCNSVSDKNPLVAGPLRRTDCSLVSDGAAALVLADEMMARELTAASGVVPVAFRAAVQVNEFLPLSRRDPTVLEGAAEAWRRALVEAKLTLDDLHLVETHDCFTIAEMMEYEAMGLTAPGDGARAIREGWTEKGGRLPVNPSGGLKAKGHPIGATGVSMHVLAAMQVTGTAPEGMQIPNAVRAGVFNMGGAAVANYASILEPLGA